MAEAGFMTVKSGLAYAAKPNGHKWKCGNCGRGVIAVYESSLRRHCLVCGGEVKKREVAAKLNAAEAKDA